MRPLPVFALAVLAAAATAPPARAQCPPLPPSDQRCYTPAYLSTQWTTVYPNEGQVYHVAEGICLDASGGLADDCLSHEFYDYNMDLLLDPAYQCLLADTTGIIHTEREFPNLPVWVWPGPGSASDPLDGDRVWMSGLFIYDCGHCEGGSDLTGCYTEIHPILAIASIRGRPDSIPASGTAGLVPAVRADVWIHGDAGCANALQCVDDDANCSDPWPGVRLCNVDMGPFPIARVWTFTLALPPRPTASAAPVWRFEPRPGDVFSALTPAIDFLPAGAPGARDSLRVTIDLTGTTGPGPFARSLVAGWSPAWSAVPIHHLRVDVTSIRIIDDLDGSQPGGGEWFFDVDVNGTRQEILGNLRTGAPATVSTGQVIALDKSWDVAVPDTGALDITSHGFETDETFGCTIENNDPGDLREHWTSADGFGIGTHAVRTVGGDALNGAAGVQYTVTEVGQPTGVEAAGGAAGSRLVLTADRGVVDGAGVRFAARVPSGLAVTLRVFAIGGAEVRALQLTASGPGAWEAVWDGRDARGQRVASGAYVAVLAADAGAPAARRLVVIR